MTFTLCNATFCRSIFKCKWERTPFLAVKPREGCWVGTKVNCLIEFYLSFIYSKYRVLPVVFSCSGNLLISFRLDGKGKIINLSIFYSLSSINLALYRKTDLCIPRNETARPRSNSYIHVSVSYTVFIHRYALTWEYINHSQIHECENWKTQTLYCKSVLEMIRPRSFISGNT